MSCTHAPPSLGESNPNLTAQAPVPLPQQAGQTLAHIIQLHPEPPEQTLLHDTLRAPGNLQIPNTLTRPRYHTFSS